MYFTGTKRVDLFYLRITVFCNEESSRTVHSNDARCTSRVVAESNTDKTIFVAVCSRERVTVNVMTTEWQPHYRSCHLHKPTPVEGAQCYHCDAVVTDVVQTSSNRNEVVARNEWR